ncbi:MAG: hypothetical protein BWY39_00408 [Spirochaetes bacterium ADurb.Bin269]|nr:MAG: hypothetical protein BWY39_00408 [Spirochaetes bacterium ADurb.Bin269]
MVRMNFQSVERVAVVPDQGFRLRCQPFGRRLEPVLAEEDSGVTADQLERPPVRFKFAYDNFLRKRFLLVAELGRLEVRNQCFTDSVFLQRSDNVLFGQIESEHSSQVYVAVDYHGYPPVSSV